jgi:predicted metal-binding membrane protein
MGYQWKVSEFVHEDRLLHLGPAATRLSAALSHPRWIAVACILTLAGSGWLALGLIAAGPGWEALCRPAALGGWGDIALVPAMWTAMTLAMMLPTAGPMILTYAEIADTAARQREPVVSPMVLTAGYVAVWLGFALAASVLQIVLVRYAMLEAGRVGALVSGALFVGAGLYQFSSLKHACLTLCRRPFPFFFANWTTETRGVFRLGLRQGMVCLGCCWAMMLLMFAVGAMNVIWMAALGMAMTVEKLATTTRVTRGLGMAFVAIGLGFLVTGLL